MFQNAESVNKEKVLTPSNMASNPEQQPSTPKRDSEAEKEMARDSADDTKMAQAHEAVDNEGRKRKK